MGRQVSYQDLEQKVEELKAKVAELQKEQLSLKRARRRLGLILDFIPYPLAVMRLDQKVFYVNRGFTELFGWKPEELYGKKLPIVPENLREEADRDIETIVREKTYLRRETKRLTKDGRTLDVVIRAAYYEESEYEPAGIMMTFRDVTEEKRLQKIKDTILRISTALPKYPELEALLDFINSEVMRLLDTEGAVVNILDEETDEIFVIGAAYDDPELKLRAKRVRFKMDEIIAGRVIRSGKPVIVNDTSEEEELHRRRDEKLGYKTRNLLLVPLHTKEKTIGVLCAINKKEGPFNDSDLELLNTIATTVALSVENARVGDELKRAYQELSSLNKAKDKMINHLSHELKTPVSILLGSLRLLEKGLEAVPEEKWKRHMERMRRNLDRIVDLQYEVSDIIMSQDYRIHTLLSLLLEQCKDELEVLVEKETGAKDASLHIRACIDQLFGPKELTPQVIELWRFVDTRLRELRGKFAHRDVEVETEIDYTPEICIPLEVLEKVFDGLVKNAIENTPDQGKVLVAVKEFGKGSELVVQDFGVGIVEENKQRIFEGFFYTQDTVAYSSKEPFDFNAGGKGADLLRMKIFSERFNFKLEMESKRCKFIPTERDLCPGDISKCPFCNDRQDCLASGGSVFRVYFPPVESEEDCNKGG